jgi:hypothetical protein
VKRLRRGGGFAVFSGAVLSGSVLASAVVLGCGPAPDPRFPPRPAGCDVKVFTEGPTLATENIGTANAICGDDVDEDACMRTLKDEVCKLGGDVVWGVGEHPTQVYGKKRWSGRVAHSK